MGGWAQNGVFFFCKIPFIKKDTNLISQTVGQTNFKSLPLWLACPKANMKRLSSDFEFFLVKNNFVYFKEQI